MAKQKTHVDAFDVMTDVLEAALSKPEPQTAAPAASAEPKLEPHEWAEKLGHIIKGNHHLPHAKTFPDVAHAVADQLHGWTKHRHHFQGPADGKRNPGPLLITKLDYEAALECASNQTTKHPKPHEAALSPAAKLKGN